MDAFEGRREELKARQIELEQALTVADCQQVSVGPDPIAWCTTKSAAQVAATSRVDSLKRYFDAMSDFPNYEERRKQRLSTVAPFSFHKRELTRPKSAATRRIESETQRRLEDEERELRSKFRANPVPPTTFVPKYEMMVDEWCARKEALRILAERRAEERKAAEQPGREFAAAMMAAKPHRNPKSQEEAHEEWQRKHCKTFVAREVPRAVVMPKMAEIQVREQDRKARIAARAAELLAISKPPPRMMRAGAVSQKRASSVEAGDAKPQDLRAINKEFTFQPSVTSAVPPYEEHWAKERLRLELRRQAKPPTNPSDFLGLRKHADESLQLAQEKVKRRAASTGVQVPSAESPHVAAVLLDIVADETKLKETRWPNQLPRGKVAPAKFTKPEPVPDDNLPTATRAHSLKAEAAFRRIVTAEDVMRRAAEDERARRDKQRLATKRMTSILAQHGLDRRNEDVIAEEARKKRQATALQSREYQKSLKALKEQLDNQLPRFLQDDKAAAALQNDASSRVATDSQVLALLKQHGLGEKSLREVMLASHAAQLSTTAVDIVAVTEAATQPTIQTAPPATVTTAAVRETLRAAPAQKADDFESSSSSSSAASSRSSSASTKRA